MASTLNVALWMDINSKENPYPQGINFYPTFAFARAVYILTKRCSRQQCYAALIKNHTGLKIPPNNIHDLGLAEVKRIKARMELAVKKVYPNQSLSIFIQNLRQDPKQFLNSRQELISYNENLLKRAQMALNKAFFKSPRTEIAIKPIEKFREANAPAAYYYEATGEKNAKAYYYLNTHKVKSRPLYNMAALAFHEAVPGHHFQIATANENKKLPKLYETQKFTAPMFLQNH